MILDKYIASLLYDHNCVIVPGFGAFIANYRSSEIDEINSLIKPPAKQIAFNPSLSNNDGLLTHYSAKEEGLSFDLASEEIEQSVKLWHEKLQKGQSIRLNKIGELSLNEDKKIIFKPYDAVNFLKDSFGLPAVNIKPLARKRITLDVDSLQEYQQEKKLERIAGTGNRKNRRIVYYAVTAYLPILIALWALFLLKEPFTGQESGFNIFSKTKVTPEKQLETKTELISEAEITDVQEYVNEEVEPVVIPEAYTGTLYYIIGGAFKESDNAETFRNSLREKNYPRSEILSGQGSYFRVSYDKFEESNEALNYLKIINQNENPEAWILKQ